MEKTGWISIHRKIQDDLIYPKGRPFTKYEAWIDLIMEVNHTDQEVLIGNRIVKCKRGQSIRSQETWAKRWNWDRSKVRRFFKMLQDSGKIESKNEQKTTRITISNYDTYQGKRPHNDHIMTTNNNDNNDKKKKDIYKEQRNFENSLPAEEQLKNNKENKQKCGDKEEEKINKEELIEDLKVRLTRWFGFNEVNHFSQLRNIHYFLMYLAGKDQLEHFKEQLYFYWKFKKESGEKRHGFKSYLGNMENNYDDGAWNTENWKKKYAEWEKSEHPEKHIKASKL